MHDDLLALARLVACPARLAALRAVGERGRDVTEVASLTGVTLSTASYHLSKLLNAGLVRFTRCGRRRVYRLGKRRCYFAMEDG